MTQETMKTQHPLGAKTPKGFALVRKYEAERITKLEQHMRALKDYTFGRIPHGDTAEFETHKRLLEDLNEAIGIRPARIDRAWGPVSTEATPHTAEGYLCSTGAHFFALKQYGDYHAKWLANFCCGPYKCHLCGAESDKNNSWCESCRSKRVEEAWQKAERVEATGMVFSETWGEFFSDLGDYLDRCANEEVAPEYGRPWNCEFIPAHVPELGELIYDEMYDEWEGDQPWLKDLQAQVEAAFKEHNPGAWHQGDTVPVLPTAESEAAR